MSPLQIRWQLWQVNKVLFTLSHLGVCSQVNEKYCSAWHRHWSRPESALAASRRPDSVCCWPVLTELEDCAEEMPWWLGSPVRVVGLLALVVLGWCWAPTDRSCLAPGSRHYCTCSGCSLTLKPTTAPKMVPRLRRAPATCGAPEIRPNCRRHSPMAHGLDLVAVLPASDTTPHLSVMHLPVVRAEEETMAVEVGSCTCQHWWPVNRQDLLTAVHVGRSCPGSRYRQPIPPSPTSLHQASTVPHRDPAGYELDRGRQPGLRSLVHCRCGCHRCSRQCRSPSDDRSRVLNCDAVSCYIHLHSFIHISTVPQLIRKIAIYYWPYFMSFCFPYRLVWQQLNFQISCQNILTISILHG